jgi:hypothetical protein
MLLVGVLVTGMIILGLAEEPYHYIGAALIIICLLVLECVFKFYEIR